MSRGMSATAHSRELMYFLMLSPVEQANAIRRLAAAGQSEQAHRDGDKAGAGADQTHPRRTQGAGMTEVPGVESNNVHRLLRIFEQLDEPSQETLLQFARELAEPLPEVTKSLRERFGKRSGAG